MAWGMLKKFQTLRAAREVKKSHTRASSLEEKARLARDLEKGLERERAAQKELERVRLLKAEVTEQRRAPVKRVLSSVRDSINEFRDSKESRQREGGVFGAKQVREGTFETKRRDLFK